MYHANELYHVTCDANDQDIQTTKTNAVPETSNGTSSSDGKKYVLKCVFTQKQNIASMYYTNYRNYQYFA